MYWQVNLHKTGVAAEYMLVYALRRAKSLARIGTPVFSSPALSFFLEKDVLKADFEQNEEVLEKFAALDDYDILQSLKVWSTHADPTLRFLSTSIVDRNLFKIEISKNPLTKKDISEVKSILSVDPRFKDQDLSYLVFSDKLTNKAYNQEFQNINVLLKSGEIIDLSKASDNLNISALARPVEKYFLCYPR